VKEDIAMPAKDLKIIPLNDEVAKPEPLISAEDQEKAMDIIAACYNENIKSIQDLPAVTGFEIEDIERVCALANIDAVAFSKFEDNFVPMLAFFIRELMKITFNTMQQKGLAEGTLSYIARQNVQTVKMLNDMKRLEEGKSTANIKGTLMMGLHVKNLADGKGS
jgi:hypothetical protein